MNINDYLNKVNDESQIIFKSTIADSASFGKAHHLSSCISEFAQILFDIDERQMLKVVSAQLESAAFTTALGFYRQGFSSLRLAFEMGLATVYFSINKMEHYEWINGKADIRWARLLDSNSGVLSSRFAKAFFPGLESTVESYSDRAEKCYRLLSEFVHGNSETWTKSGISLKLNSNLEQQFFRMFEEVCEIILITLCCRYLRSLPKEALENLEAISIELNHVSAIRELFGGPKE